jgi:hypothetical protein
MTRLLTLLILAGALTFFAFGSLAMAGIHGGPI